MASENHFNNEHDEFGEIIRSKAIRAGKRTYFFDVKATQGNDYYLVITESRRRNNSDGSATYSRHHMYLYKEVLAIIVKQSKAESCFKQLFTGFRYRLFTHKTALVSLRQELV